MSAIRKFIVFGPSDTLKRMAKVIHDGTNPQYTFTSNSTDQSKSVSIFVYEEHQKLLNSSISVTLIIETSNHSVKAEIVTTGGRMGFSGSLPNEENSLSDTVTDQIVDFAKRFGLTIQGVVDNANADTEA